MIDTFIDAPDNPTDVAEMYGEYAKCSYIYELEYTNPATFELLCEEYMRGEL